MNAASRMGPLRTTVAHVTLSVTSVFDNEADATLDLEKVPANVRKMLEDSIKSEIRFGDMFDPDVSPTDTAGMDDIQLTRLMKAAPRCVAVKYGSYRAGQSDITFPVEVVGIRLDTRDPSKWLIELRCVLTHTSDVVDDEEAEEKFWEHVDATMSDGWGENGQEFGPECAPFGKQYVAEFGLVKVKWGC